MKYLKARAHNILILIPLKVLENRNLVNIQGMNYYLDDQGCSKCCVYIQASCHIISLNWYTQMCTTKREISFSLYTKDFGAEYL